MAIKINTGKEEFELDFGDGIKESIYFNPHDDALGVKLCEFHKKVSERMSALEDVEIDDKGEAIVDNEYITPEIALKIEARKMCDKIIYEEVDNVFSSKISDIVFKHRSPLAKVNGVPFVLVLVDCLMPEIEARREKAKKESNAAIEKFVSKYKKNIKADE